MSMHVDTGIAAWRGGPQVIKVIPKSLRARRTTFCSGNTEESGGGDRQGTCAQMLALFQHSWRSPRRARGLDPALGAAGGIHRGCASICRFNRTPRLLRIPAKVVPPLIDSFSAHPRPSAEQQSSPWERLIEPPWRPRRVLGLRGPAHMGAASAIPGSLMLGVQGDQEQCVW
ncbi:hypothetical protein AGIG_G16789 [Arapaima gigas]